MNKQKDQGLLTQHGRRRTKLEVWHLVTDMTNLTPGFTIKLQ